MLSDNVSLWIVFTAAIAGSFHCIGMCGPIVLALPIPRNKLSNVVFSRLFYNLGRIVTYMILGLIAGLIGSKLQLFRYQQTISIILGVLLLTYLIIPRNLKLKVLSSDIIARYTGSIRCILSYFFKKQNLHKFFFIGLLNGLLPCGFVYLALSASILQPNILRSAIVMAVFGLGTVPAMLTFSIVAKFFTQSFRMKFAKALPYLAVVLALIFIIRGLNLGIPYLSPNQKNACCIMQ